MNFSVTLTEADWDAVSGGWRFPALQIPNAAVKAVFVNGLAVDPKMYSADHGLHMLRWAPKGAPPKLALAHLEVSKALSTHELTLRWKKLAIVLPVIGTLGAAVIARALLASPSPRTSTPEHSVEMIFKQSNDFLANGSDERFAPTLARAKREVWFAGTTFYISVDQFYSVLLKKASEGVDLRFIVLNPDNGNAKRVAALFGVSESELNAQCVSGLKTLYRLAQEARTSGFNGTVQTRLANDQMQSRLYLFDPRSNDGVTYFVPQINLTNAATLPGFLVRNSTNELAARYFDGVLKLWNSSSLISIDEWIRVHPELAQ